MCTEVICKLTSLWPSGCVSSQICMMDTGTCRRVPHSWEGKPKGTRVRSIMAVCQWNVCNCVVVWPFTHCPEEQEGTVMALWNRYASENCSCPADAMSYNTIYNSLSFSLPTLRVAYGCEAPHLVQYQISDDNTLVPRLAAWLHRWLWCSTDGASLDWSVLHTLWKCTKRNSTTPFQP